MSPCIGAREFDDVRDEYPGSIVDGPGISEVGNDVFKIKFSTETVWRSRVMYTGETFLLAKLFRSLDGAA